NDAVLAYDAANRIIIASVRVADKTSGKEIVDGHYETWAFDAGKNAWHKMNPTTEPPGWGNRRRIMVYVPDQNAVLMENYINPSQRVPGVDREQQMWTYRYGMPKAAPAATDLQVRTDADSATLTWKPSPSPGVSGYVVHRGEGTRPWQADFRPV